MEDKSIIKEHIQAEILFRVCSNCLHSKLFYSSEYKGDILECQHMLSFGWGRPDGVSSKDTCRYFEKKDKMIRS